MAGIEYRGLYNGGVASAGWRIVFRPRMTTGLKMPSPEQKDEPAAPKGKGQPAPAAEKLAE
ncbi:MAG: hypothetical protein ACM3S1_03225 [Hyphomicrobiales bacterium]